MITRRRITRRLALSVVAAAGLVINGLTPASAGVTNGNAGYLVVYDNNIENIPVPLCGADWNKLFTYIKAQPYSPDLFTVQQISNQTQLNSLVQRMTDELPGTYAGVIAIASPGELANYDNPCTDGTEPEKPAFKKTQTNAVIYRTERFTAGSIIRWRSDAPEGSNHTGNCYNLDVDHGGSVGQDRVENVAIRLHDKIANKDVNVGTIHWPTGDPWNGPECALENIHEAEDRTASLGAASLTIIGGDANTIATKQGWWDDAKTYGFKDAICASAATCPTSTYTSGGKRIDFLLAKGTTGFANNSTISESTTGGKYSDHLALRADVKY